MRHIGRGARRFVPGRGLLGDHDFYAWWLMCCISIGDMHKNARLSIRFLGGAGTVTGSKFLIETPESKVLIDCGLFQGIKELRLQNWGSLPIDPAQVDQVILTHAHLDHIGYLPILVRNGFRGKILCTHPTRELAKIILVDSAHIQEEDADFANRSGFSKHAPARPLYTTREALAALKLFSSVVDDKWVKLSNQVKFRFSNSGHILGSAFVELSCGGKRIVFSGDLGRRSPLILKPREQIAKADYLIVESTYGDRIHSSVSPMQFLRRVINDTVSRGGQLIIPSFAVGRVQDVLFLISKLKQKGQIPKIPVYLDSPMGIHATEVLLDYPEWHRLDARDVESFCANVNMVRNQQESQVLIQSRSTAIIVAGSGMVSGGRVLHHLAARVGDPRSTILLVGYQAEGTRGRLLRDGTPELKMFGKYFPVKARIEELPSLSAHADQRELLDWLKGFRKPPEKVFLVHGEPQASDALRVRIRDELEWDVRIPKQNEEFIL